MNSKRKDLVFVLCIAGLWGLAPRVVAEGQPCGTGCPAGEYCQTPVGVCGGEGVCAVSPAGCEEIIAPVCGCNGVSYVNACAAASLGISLRALTECDSFNCPPAVGFHADPPHGTVDARQPFPPAGFPLQGIGSAAEPIMLYMGVTGVTLDCFSLCETHNVPYAPNEITGLYDLGDGSYTLTLARAITPNAATWISYKNDQHVTYYAHPGNANDDEVASPADVLFVVDMLNGIATPPHGIYSQDIDRSQIFGAPDILRTIDLLNGAGAYAAQNFTKIPNDECPRFCGTNAPIPACPADQYCVSISSDVCSQALGQCADKPLACPDPQDFESVCGCNGVTYGSACLAALAGVSAAFHGSCELPCGGPDGIECVEGYCGFEFGTCGANGEVGYCAIPPSQCSFAWVPVCGCDGTTYWNWCHALKNGINVASTGKCP